MSAVYRLAASVTYSDDTLSVTLSDDETCSASEPLLSLTGAGKIGEKESGSTPPAEFASATRANHRSGECRGNVSSSVFVLTS